MALNANLEALLKHMTAEQAAIQRKTWEDNPAIAEETAKFFVPQSEFSRRLAEEKTRADNAETKTREHKEWIDRNKPKQTQLIADYEALEAKNRDLQKKLDEKIAAAATEAGIDPKKIEEALAERFKGQTVSMDAVTAAINEQVGKINTAIDDARKEFLTQTFPSTTQFMTALTDIQLDHRDEFKERLDRKALSDYMRDKNIIDPLAAYNQWIAPRREAAKKTADDARIETEVQKRLDAEIAKRNLPGVTPTTGTMSDSQLTLRVAGKGDGFTFAENTELGDLSAAALAADELRKEGRA